jgi:LysM repeat protein
MPEYRPNRAARLAAVLALLGALLVFIVLIATSGGGSDGDEGGAKGRQVERNGPTRQGQRATERGVWVVHEGDTLAQISEETGIDVDELLQLNPDLDPQALLQGQRIALK